MKKWQKQLTALVLALTVSMSFSLPASALSLDLEVDLGGLKDLVGDFLGGSDSGGSNDSGSADGSSDSRGDEDDNDKGNSDEKDAQKPEANRPEGWVQQGGSWFYYRDGAPVTGWLQLGKDWYYLKDSGAMATGWLQLGNTWYYLKGSGAMATGWLQLGKNWYYLKGSGAMATGWLQLGKDWYYLRPSGVMATGPQAIDGRNYTFRSSGVWTGSSTAITGLQGQLNSIALNPKATGSERLNKLVRDFIRTNLSDDMDTYTKVKTTFDYMIKNYTYNNSPIDVSDDPEMNKMFFNNGTQEILAIWILERGYGVCDNYSAAFAAIMQAIGLDCRVVNGIAYTTSGSGSGHAWTVINIGGSEYIFDPQIEQNIAQRDGKIHYYRFGLPTSSMAGKYAPSSYQDFEYQP